MKTIRFQMRQSIIILAFTLCIANTLWAEPTDSISSLRKAHVIQINALELMGHFYSGLYVCDLSPKDKLTLGLAYENPRYDFGTTHAYALILGYRRYFWKGLNAEYALWPAYNHFYESNEQRYYNSAELWGEFRAGYDFEFGVGLKHVRFIVTPQFIAGKGLITGYKPKSFHDYYKNEEPVFIAGNIALSVKF